MGSDAAAGSGDHRRRPGSKLKPFANVCLFFACNVAGVLIALQFDRTSIGSLIPPHGRRDSPTNPELVRSTLESARINNNNNNNNDNKSAVAWEESRSSFSVLNALLGRQSKLEAVDEADVALLQAAVEAEHARGQLRDPMPPRKLAFLFSSQGGPMHLAKLWCQFLYGHEGKYSLYLHIPQGQESSNEELPACFQATVIHGKDPLTTSLAKIDAHRRLLAHALLDVENARFIFLSAECIPIFNFFFIHNYLMGTPMSFVKGWTVEGDGGSNRWHRGFLPLIKKGAWRKGSQWAVLDRNLAHIVVKDTSFYQKFKDECTWAHKCCCYEEHYLPTMLHILAPSALGNRSLTWTEWSERTRSWRTFSRNDVRPQLVDYVREKPACTWNENPEANCFLFAQRMGADTLDPLLVLGSSMGY